MRFASPAVWAGQGITGITIVNPKGESYDIDGFGLIVSTKEEEKAPEPDPLRDELAKIDRKSVV